MIAALYDLKYVFLLLKYFTPDFFFSGSKTSASASVSKSNLSLHNTSSGSGGSNGISLKSAGIFREADVFLLCYRISDPASLFSAINFWCPEIRCYAPTTPIILVGCQSDLRYPSLYRAKFLTVIVLFNF